MAVGVNECGLRIAVDERCVVNFREVQHVHRKESVAGRRVE